MTMAPPGTEQLYLRMLLNHVGGPKSFNDLKIHMELFNNKKKLHLQMDYYTMMLNMMHRQLLGLVIGLRVTLQGNTHHNSLSAPLARRWQNIR